MLVKWKEDGFEWRSVVERLLWIFFLGWDVDILGVMLGLLFKFNTQLNLNLFKLFIIIRFGVIKILC
jgi:hypothetical protein